MNEQILKMIQITKTYYMGKEEQIVLNNINLSVNKGDFVAILGPSGSGKSTLMNIIGCLDSTTSGDYILSNQKVDELDEIDLAAIRNKEVGFVFQQFQLLPKLSAIQNVELPLVYARVAEKDRKRRAREILERVGLGEKLHNRPNQLSGGQQQRVAIARAMITEPTILLANEPTGALDQKTGHQIMDLFHELHEEGKTIIMITHDIEIARNASRIVRILDGKLREESVMFKENLKMSWMNLIHNKMRSFLTMLGIVILVASIIALITIVKGTMNGMTSEFSSFGADKNNGSGNGDTT